MDRRTFLHGLATVFPASFLPMDWSTRRPKGLEKIGIQLFSLPKLLEKDFRGALELLAEMGYREVELFGPYPFSAPAAVERWAAITPALGFSGSGYFGHSAAEVRSMLEDCGLRAPAMHTDLLTLETRMNALGEAGAALGFEYVGLPAIPPERRQTLDDYKEMAEAFNRIGAAAKKEGLKFSYHNHGYGLQELEDRIPLQLLLEETDPDLVFFEMDIYWTSAGGADPVAYLDAHPGRYHLLHLKDMKERVRFSGDGGDPSQWMALFPYMTSAGDGILELEAIIAKAVQTGVRHFFVEQDMVANPEVALKRSYDYLEKLK